jgi:hypothetical protein
LEDRLLFSFFIYDAEKEPKLSSLFFFDIEQPNRREEELMVRVGILSDAIGAPTPHRQRD